MPSHCATIFSPVNDMSLTRSQLARWNIVAVFDIFTEGIIFGIAVYIVALRQMALKTKVMVLAAFAFRLPYVI